MISEKKISGYRGTFQSKSKSYYSFHIKKRKPTATPRSKKLKKKRSRAASIIIKGLKNHYYMIFIILFLFYTNAAFSNIKRRNCYTFQTITNFFNFLIYLQNFTQTTTIAIWAPFLFLLVHASNTIYRNQIIKSYFCKTNQKKKKNWLIS